MSNIALCQTKAAQKIAKIRPKLPHLRLPEHAKQTTSPHFRGDARATCIVCPALNFCKTNAAEQCPPRVKFCFCCVLAFFCVLCCYVLCCCAARFANRVCMFEIACRANTCKTFWAAPGNSRSCLHIVRCNAVKFGCNALLCAPLEQCQHTMRLHNCRYHSCLNCSSEILPL